MASSFDDSNVMHAPVKHAIIPELARKEHDRILDSHGYIHKSMFILLKSNEKRYSYVLGMIPNLHDIFPDIKASSQKCALTAERLKSKGNKAFGLGQYEKAQDLYTQSVAYAVPDHLNEQGRNTLALSLANRSGALFFSGKHNECLVDIGNALQIGYPQDLKYKLYDRKAKCYQALKSYRAAEVSFKIAALLSKEEPVEEKRKQTKKQILKHIDFCVRNSATNIEMNLKDIKGELPKLSDEPNTTHPSLSSACVVDYRPRKGRCVVAARDIKPGEVILVEKPFVSVFVPNLKYKDCCHHCFYPCNTLLPCLRCTTARYCSPECRDLSWETYHKYECGIPFDHLIGEGSSFHCAVRVALVAGVECLRRLQQKQSENCVEKMSEMVRGCNEEGQYLSTDYTSVYHLNPFKDVLGSCDMDVTIISVFLVKLLEKMGFFDSIEGQRHQAMASAGACIISSLLSMLPSSDEIHHSIPVAYPDDAFIIVGLSVYPTYKLFNHSCNIETCKAFYGDNLVVHALQSYKQGQEICVSYGPSFYDMERNTRQDYLDDTSLFPCLCEPCRHNWPQLHDISGTPTFKCTGCEAPLYDLEMDFFQCKHCKLIQSLRTKLEALMSASQLLTAARQSSEFHLYMEYIAAIDKLLVQPWRNYVVCKLSVDRSLRQKGSHACRRYQE